MPRSARLPELIQSLRPRRHPVPAAELAVELGVSIRTMYRNVATLAASGAPIEGAAGLGYVFRPGFYPRPLMSGEDELDAMILGLCVVAKRGDPSLEQAAGMHLPSSPPSCRPTGPRSAHAVPAPRHPLRRQACRQAALYAGLLDLARVTIPSFTLFVLPSGTGIGPVAPPYGYSARHDDWCPR